ncbi:serine protease [Brevundimonas sp.]|uniref:S1 family peptidase n=1 Tax=Brevundimonas sp. TaxID=1871086 RepID=UPI001DDBA0A5|nr:serine protease [Brevundimonas sp.]MBL0948168.1 trypsin-like peptidase domain-containing protein [Brevundimonas sp.]
MGRLTDWAFYGLLSIAILIWALDRREEVYTPPPPPAPDRVEGALLGPITPFDPAITLNAPDIPFQPASGTAFSIAGKGRWVTARHVVEGCRKPALMVGGGRAVAASLRLAPRADIAVLITEGGPDPLAVVENPQLRKGQRGFHPGYPQGRAGEVTSRLLGRETFRVRGRGERDEPVLAWAEVGRTAGLKGTLSGLSGAPVLDRQGRVLGVTIAEAPRRGRVYTTAPDTFGPAIRGMPDRDARPLPEPVTLVNYGRVADALRRDLRVAQVVCLPA